MYYRFEDRDEPKEGFYLVLPEVTIYQWDLRVKGLESSQDHQDPIGMLEALETVVIEYEGAEYDLGAYGDLVPELQDTLLEWLSPT